MGLNKPDRPGIKLNNYLEHLRFKRYPSKHAVCTRRENDNVLVVVVYEDDLVVTGTSVPIIDVFKTLMSNIFEMSNLGKMTYYRGIEVEQGIG